MTQQGGSLRFPGYYPAMRKPCRENCIRLFTCVAEYGEQRSRMVKKKKTHKKGKLISKSNLNLIIIVILDLFANVGGEGNLNLLFCIFKNFSVIFSKIFKCLFF